jgi:predicted ATPase/DNA-binding winged helix-turn-helix (wHTH) protein
MADAFEFGSFRLIIEQRILLEKGKPVRLSSRAFDILSILLDNAGKVVASAELISRVWPNVVVEEANLRINIAALRRTLGEGRQGRRFIVNVRGKGYCFVAAAARSRGKVPLVTCAASKEATNRLPLLPIRIIGQEQTMEKLLDLGRQQRLLTIVGMGGIGKTTIAIAVAHRLANEYDDGSVFVDLSSLVDPAMVPAALASTLGIPVQSTDPIPSLCSYLIGKRALIVFDNCEHVVDTASRLIERLLQTAPQISIIATSREPLRLPGEKVHRLMPLGLPGEGSSTTVPELLAYPATQLFVERAIASSDSFAFKDTDIPFVVEICRKVDGLPLAIELAAAAVEMFGARDLAARLDDRFALLTRGHRTAIARQRTLLAVFDWSYDLLSEEEQTVFRRLSIFRAGFNPDAARSVVASTEVEAASVFDCLLALAEKSLVAIDKDGETVGCRLLESARAYAWEKVKEKGEQATLARRHAEHLIQIFEIGEAGSETRSDTRQRHFQLLDDVRSALDWAFSADGDGVLGAKLTAAAVPLWVQFASFAECRRRVDQAIPYIVAQDDASLRCKMRLHCALGAIGHLSLPNPLDPARAIETWRVALGLAERLEDVELRLSALWGLWFANYVVGENGSCLGFARRFVAEAAQSPDRALELIGKRLVGVTQHVMGDQTAARRHLEPILAHPINSSIYRARFQFDQQISARTFLARTLWLQGHLGEAMENAERCVDDALALGHGPTMLSALVFGGCPIALQIGDIATAERFVAIVHEHSKKHQALGLHATYFDGWLLIRKGECASGAKTLDLALKNYFLPSKHFNAAHAAGLQILADAHLSMGNLDEALEAIKLALDDADRGEGKWCVPELLRLKAMTVLNRPLHGDGAVTLLEKSLEIARAQGSNFWELKTATSLARLWCTTGRCQEALAVLGPVCERFRRELQAPDVRIARELVENIEASSF